MLALSDEALARVMIGATRVRASERGRWLRQIAERLDPPADRLNARARKARERARARNGVRQYRLEISDRAIEGLIRQWVATGRITSGEADRLDDHAIARLLARDLETYGRQWAA